MRIKEGLSESIFGAAIEVHRVCEGRDQKNGTLTFIIRDSAPLW